MRLRSDTPDDELEGLSQLHQLLAHVSKEIGPALELGAVLRAVLAAMRSLVEFRGGSICLVDDRGVYIAASDPPVSDDVAASRVPVGTGLAGRIVAEGTPVYSPDLDADPRVDPAQRRLGSNTEMRSYLGVPLVVFGDTIGVMQIDAATPDGFTRDDLTLLEGLATQVAGSIESARRYEEVLELERLKRDFVARVSHELKTPLTVISGFIDLLRSHAENLTDVQRDWLARIAAADLRLSQLIDELLAISSAEAGVTEARPERVLAAQVLHLVREASINRSRVIVRAPDHLELVTDPLLLRRALALLVDNALKYAGDVVLTAASDPDTGTRYVEVRDHGPGIPPALRSHLFERFTRGDQSEPGMGLGLAMVSKLAAALHVTVELADPPGGGVSFTLRFG